MGFDPHVAGLLASTGAIGLLMALAGLQKNALVRRHRRICPSCGRELQGRTCAYC